MLKNSLAPRREILQRYQKWKDIAVISGPSGLRPIKGLAAMGKVHALQALLPIALLWVSACQDEPRLVYVPASPVEVELLVRASATEVTVGTPVVLSAERYYRARWKQVERKSLPDGQCWVGRPPPDREGEVADNLDWKSSPDEPARFNIVYRQDRTREVVFSKAGTYVLNATSVVYCGSPDTARAKPITITVRNSLVNG